MARHRTVPKETPEKKRITALRDAFVREYVKDFNGTRAALAVGVSEARAGQSAYEWLREPYVIKQLSDLMDRMEEKSIVTRNKVLFGLLKEANYHGLDGSSASRVAAWGKLAKILGMEVIKFEGDVKVRHNVMVVPLAATTQAWEDVAASMQSDLVKHRGN